MKPIIINVIGGVAYLNQKPAGVAVIIRDYDNNEDHDGNPQEKSEEEYDEDEVIDA